MTAVSQVHTTITCDGPGCSAYVSEPATRTALRARLARRGWIRRTVTDRSQPDYCPVCAPATVPGPAGPGRPKASSR